MSSRPWLAGWTAGSTVVAVAAGLLAANIALGRRIVRQAREIETGLVTARESTNAIFDLSVTNHALGQIAGHLRGVREGAGG